MEETNIDAESVTRNKTYTAFDHLMHLIKVGWSPDSPLIKKLLKENNLSDNDLSLAIKKLEEIS